ncbi:MAG: hypothetical protein KBA53_11995 [Thermoclostridium sp.]|nr:hypothetical protein [Thermoclostridium sp.]
MACRLESRVMRIRTLDSDIIIKIAVFIVFLLTLAGLNIYLQVSRKRTFLLNSISAVSFFIGVFLFCLIMETAILDLPAEKVFRQLRMAALVLGLITLVGSATYLVIRRRQALTDTSLSPDLSAVFEVLNDITVISDSQGNILEMKQPERIMLFEVNCKTLEELKRSLSDDAAEHSLEAVEQAFRDLSREHQFELFFKNRLEEYLVRITPILSSRGKRIGTSLLFHDIHKEKQLIRDVQAYNQSLTAANAKLTHYMETASTLEAEKERLRVFQNIQSELVEKIQSITAELPAAQELPEDGEPSAEMLERLTEELREVYEQVRKSIRSISEPIAGGNYDTGNHCG